MYHRHKKIARKVSISGKMTFEFTCCQSNVRPLYSLYNGLAHPQSQCGSHYGLNSLCSLIAARLNAFLRRCNVIGLNRSARCELWGRCLKWSFGPP